MWRSWAAAILAAVLVAGGMLLQPASSVGSPLTPVSSPKAFPKDQVVEVSISLSDADLADLYANATQEKEYPADVTWNGQLIQQVAVRAKGNSSLSSVARSDTKRYSLKLDLDKFVDGQSLNGIGTINLNNGFSDASYMREILSYEAFASLGVPTPATTWVNLTVNGELKGLFLAVEQIGQPYLERYFADGNGDLYKPANQMGSGADLKWYGDSMDQYTGVVYKTKDKNTDHRPLLDMLNVLNNGGDLEQHLDVDGILKYFAASTVMANFDSYQGSMLHNYYLYEQNGRFTVLPWDLNMSFAGFSMGGTPTQMVEVKIDEPTMGALADRPLIAKLLAVPAYLERYHGYIRQLVEGYLDPVAFEQRARAVTALIDPYVKADPTKFVTYEQFRAALDQEMVADSAPVEGQGRGGMAGGPGMGSSVGLLTFVKARVANVKQQLDGTLPSKGDGSGMGTGGRGGFPAGGQQGAPGAGGRNRVPQGGMPQGGMPPAGFDPAQAGRMPLGGQQRPGGADEPAPVPVATWGIQTDLMPTLALGALLLLGTTAVLWRSRPRG